MISENFPFRKNKMCEVILKSKSISTLSFKNIFCVRCVEAINFTHNPVDAQMDVKLRSLICLGLNEQVIHAVLCMLNILHDYTKEWG